MRLPTFYEQNLIPNWGISLHCKVIKNCEIPRLCVCLFLADVAAFFISRYHDIMDIGFSCFIIKSGSFETYVYLR